MLIFHQFQGPKKESDQQKRSIDCRLFFNLYFHLALIDCFLVWWLEKEVLIRKGGLIVQSLLPVRKMVRVLSIHF